LPWFVSFRFTVCGDSLDRATAGDNITEGRVIIGSSILSSIAPNADVLATGKRKESSGGRYYLNGYTITIETDAGDLSHSYIGSFHDKDKVTAVMFRDKFYSARLKGN